MISDTMNIGFDGKRAVRNFTGLGNYSRYVIEYLCRHYPNHQYTLYAPKEGSGQPFTEMMRQCPALKTVYAKGIWKRARAAWRSWGVTRQLEQDGIQIYHGLSNELPLNIRQAKGVRSVVTIHDLIFLRHPEFYPAIDRKIYAYKFRQACLQADAIIAISECTKRDIQEFFGIPEEKIHVIYQGCDPIFTRPVTEEEKQRVRTKYNLPTRYILNVGTLEARKNAALLAKAHNGQCPDDVHLVLVGRTTPYVKEIQRFANWFVHRDNMHILPHVPTEDLPALYAGAELFVYPSLYEGFGIPILEDNHIPYVCFISPSFLGKERYINESELNSLRKSIYCSIGAHGINHRLFRKLTTNEKLEEISKEKHEQLLGCEIEDFAFPYGSLYACDNLSIKYARKEYLRVYSSLNYQTRFEDLKYFIPRINLNSSFIAQNRLRR